MIHALVTALRLSVAMSEPLFIAPIHVYMVFYEAWTDDEIGY
jgi:hypothetical protein